MRAKICGLSDAASLEASVQAGAAYVGLVFFGKSPRNVSVKQASQLGALVPEHITTVGLFVDPDDQFLDERVFPAHLNMIQLHGSETPERVAEVKARFGLPVMKAVGVREADDLKTIEKYRGIADQILIDAKAPKDGPLPGGNGLSFDWQLLQDFDVGIPWMLAGGLTPENVATAAKLTGATQFDVSSGVESAPGVKDPDRIRAFLKAIQEPLP